MPALFAAGEALGLAKADVAKGLVVGVEVANPLSMVAGNGVHAVGFHPTAILGTISMAMPVSPSTPKMR